MTDATWRALGFALGATIFALGAILVLDVVIRAAFERPAVAGLDLLGFAALLGGAFVAGSAIFRDPPERRGRQAEETMQP